MRHQLKRAILCLGVIAFMIFVQNSNSFVTSAAVQTTSSEKTQKAAIQIKNVAAPSEKHSFGKNVNLKGVISSSSELTSVNVKITSQDGKKVYRSHTAKPYATSYSISKAVNSKVKLDNLTLGKYKYTIKATNKAGRTEVLLSKNFEIVGKQSTLKISASLSDAKIYKGKSTVLSGKVTSNYKIKEVTAEVSGTKYKRTAKPYNTSYTISKTLNSAMNFSKLPKGVYTVKITAVDASGKKVSSNIKLTVIRYDEINYKIRGIKQRTYSDCALASMATCEYYNETCGRGKHGKALVNSKDPYVAMKSRNGNSTYGNWSNISYEKSYSLSPATLYNALKKGPVIVHKQNGYRTHYSVVYGYEGSDNQLSYSKFKVYEVTNGATLNMTSWLGAKTSANINGSGRFDHMIVKR